MKIWISAMSVRRYLKLQSLLFFFILAFAQAFRHFVALLFVGWSINGSRNISEALDKIVVKVACFWEGIFTSWMIMSWMIMYWMVMSWMVMSWADLDRGGVVLKNTSWMVMARIAVSKKSDHRIQA